MDELVRTKFDLYLDKDSLQKWHLITLSCGCCFVSSFSLFFVCVFCLFVFWVERLYLIISSNNNNNNNNNALYLAHGVFNTVMSILRF